MMPSLYLISVLNMQVIHTYVSLIYMNNFSLVSVPVIVLRLVKISNAN